MEMIISKSRENVPITQLQRLLMLASHGSIRYRATSVCACMSR